MKILHCHLNGPRNITEFAYGGELKTIPDQMSCSDREWADYVFYEDNRAGVVTEWWFHTPSGYWFLAERNTLTDEVIRTFDASQVFPNPHSNVPPETITVAAEVIS